MKGFGKLLLTETKLYFRMPINAFFTLALPLAMLLVFGAIFGNEPLAAFGGYGTVDRSAPAYCSLIIVMSSLLSLPITLAGYRERGVLKRLRATPLRPAAALGAQLVIQMAASIAGFFLLFLAGRLAFDMRFEGSLAGALAAFAFGSLSFSSLGLVLASVLPSARTVTVVGNILVYPLVWFSGAAIPLEMMPSAMRGAARYVPLTHVVTLLQGAWKGEPLSGHLTEVLVLALILAAGSLVAVKTFRWE